MYKKLAIAAAIAAMSVGAQAQSILSKGDIAFTGLSTHSTAGGWSFATFVDLSAGTSIYFTDTSVQTAGTFTTFEAAWKWTATSAVAAGSVVTIGNYGSGNTSVTQLTTLGAGAISSSGDTLFAYQATDSTYTSIPSTFLAAISNRAQPYAATDDPAGGAGLSGSALINIRNISEAYIGVSGAVGCVSNASCRFGEFDGVKGSTGVYGDVAAMKAAIADPTNWTSIQASNSVQLATFSGSMIAAVPEPSTYAMLLAGLGMMGVIARRRSRA